MKAIGGKSWIVVFLILHMWLEVAIKESDGLIAVISEKYMHSTYCNNGISLCAQRFYMQLIIRAVCRNGHGTELRTAAVPYSVSRNGI